MSGQKKRRIIRVDHDQPVVSDPPLKTDDEAAFEAWMDAEAGSLEPTEIRRYAFEGTPREIGEAYGESLRDEIAELYAFRIRRARSEPKALLAAAKRCLPESEAYDPEGYEELAGIARGSGLAIEQVLAMNGLTDVDEGCSSFVIQRDRTEDQHLYLGQAGDPAPDELPYVIAVHRKPNGRPATWSMTAVGCLSRIGMNAEGAAVGTTSGRSSSKDSRPGVTHLQIVHRALRESGLGAIECAIVAAPRAGAHDYFAGDATEAAIAVECTATRAETTRRTKGYHLAGDAGDASSELRRARMGALFERAKDKVSRADLQRFLDDRDAGGISSSARVILCPNTRGMWVCHGSALTAAWVELPW